MSTLTQVAGKNIVNVEGSYVKRFAFSKSHQKVVVWLNDSMRKYIGEGTTKETFNEMKNFNGESFTKYFRNEIMNGKTYKFNPAD